MSTGHPLGIDVGGSGIKGAPVDLERGEFVHKRLRIDTPVESTPEAVCDVIARVVDHFDEVRSDSPIGVTIPGVVQHGVVKTAANIDKAWIGCEIEKLLEDRLQHDVVVVNDADAAGVGELEFGAAKGHQGLVILTTLGTGIGTAIFNRGVLVPNSELGHLEIDGHVAEKRAAASIKTMEGLSWEEYAERLTTYYRTVEKLFSPDLLVVGGGVSKDSAEFLHLVKISTEIIPATLRNRAGIIGAAVITSE
jgi:polyphosphate glucokinase